MQIYLERASLVGFQFLDSFLALLFSLPPAVASFIEFGLQKSKKEHYYPLSFVTPGPLILSHSSSLKSKTDIWQESQAVWRVYLLAVI